MNTWSKRAMLAVLSSALLVPGWGTAMAADAPASAKSLEQTSYRLNPSLQAEVKGIAVERTADGVRVGAVVRLNNVTKQIARVPEYELHIVTADGVEYKLEPSAANSRSVRPQSETELSYMVEVVGPASLDVTNLQWVDVDYYSYPREQTVVVDVPADGLVWDGIDSGADEADASVWGKPFTLKGLKSQLVYTPVAINEQTTAEGLKTVIKLLVRNTGKQKETVPVLTIEGTDGAETFAGERAEAGDIVLQPNDDDFIHLVLPTKPDADLKSVAIGTNEVFTAMATGAPQTTVYRVGRVTVALPSAATTMFTAKEYKLGDAVDLSRVTDIVPKHAKVSLVEMSMYETPGSYKTVVAKVKVENTGTKVLPIPPFQAELASKDGYQYAGTRQSNAPASVLPGLASVVTYTFTVPSKETGENVTLKLQQPVISASGTMYRSDLAAVKLDVEQPGSDKVFSFYPFTVALKSEHFSTMYNVATGYSYKLKLDLEITQDEKVVADRDFSLMEIEIVDALGRTLGTSELSFVTGLPNGNRQLISGETVVYFTNLFTEQMESNLTIKIYEKIQTEAGPVKRLVTTIK